ncbi:hypothetical protein Ddc_14230 [Ditylenchus destructor]|nr:hypothetical protein Ddc_14230 [Ditylenchus destructor]
MEFLFVDAAYFPADDIISMPNEDRRDSTCRSTLNWPLKASFYRTGFDESTTLLARLDLMDTRETQLGMELCNMILLWQDHGESESEVGFDPGVEQCSTWSNVVELESNRADFWHLEVFNYGEFKYDHGFDSKVEQCSTWSNVVELESNLADFWNLEVFNYGEFEYDVEFDSKVEQCSTWSNVSQNQLFTPDSLTKSVFEQPKGARLTDKATVKRPKAPWCHRHHLYS